MGHRLDVVVENHEVFHVLENSSEDEGLGDLADVSLLHDFGIRI